MTSGIRVQDSPVGRVVCPPDSCGAVVLYLPGEADTDSTMDTAERLAGMTGATVVCTRRRSTFPEAFDDVRVAYRYAKQVGAVTVVGEQVGAGLAAGLLVHLRDLGRPLPRRAVLVSALLDLTMQANSLVLNSRADPSFNVKRLRQRAAEYAGNAVLTDPLLSPLYANLHGLPPLQLLVAGTDPLLDDSLAFATRAARSGVTVDLRVWSDRSTLVAESLNAMTEFIVAGGTRADAPARLSAVAG